MSGMGVCMIVFFYHLRSLCIVPFIDEPVDFIDIVCEMSEDNDYSPFASKAEALLYMMINSPRPLVSLHMECKYWHLQLSDLLLTCM